MWALSEKVQSKRDLNFKMIYEKDNVICLDCCFLTPVIYEPRNVSISRGINDIVDLPFRHCIQVLYMGIHVNKIIIAFFSAPTTQKTSANAW